MRNTAFTVKMAGFLLVITTIVFLSVSAQSTTVPLAHKPLLCEGEGWIPYSNIKCFKLIKQYVPKPLANQICGSVALPTEAYPPRLASIRSEEEQEFITELLTNITKSAINIWIEGERYHYEDDESSSPVSIFNSMSSGSSSSSGTTRTGTSGTATTTTIKPLSNSRKFIWPSDGLEMKYTNWIPGRPTLEQFNTNHRDCIEIPYQHNWLSNQSSTLWKDVNCDKANWILCEKTQVFTLSQCHQGILALTKEYEGKILNAFKGFVTFCSCKI